MVNGMWIRGPEVIRLEMSQRCRSGRPGGLLRDEVFQVGLEILDDSRDFPPSMIMIDVRHGTGRIVLFAEVIDHFFASPGGKATPKVRRNN